MNLKRPVEATRSWWVNTPREELNKQAQAELERMNRSREAQLVPTPVVAAELKTHGKWR